VCAGRGTTDAGRVAALAAGPSPPFRNATNPVASETTSPAATRMAERLFTPSPTPASLETASAAHGVNLKAHAQDPPVDGAGAGAGAGAAAGAEPLPPDETTRTGAGGAASTITIRLTILRMMTF
jgi:hypothetical protein